MNNKQTLRFSLTFFGAVLALLAATAALQAQNTGRFLGSISSISGNTITVKTDGGETHEVQVPEGASLKRIEPGQKDLSSAVSMTFTDLAVGDRVLIKLDPGATTAPPSAALIIAIKASDVAKKQEQEREEWQRRGISGLVKSVDASSGTITVTTGAGSTAKTVTVKTGTATVLKRYAPGSVRFADAQAAPMSEIKAGDQLRARGSKNVEGTEIAADEVVSGTFRNVAGLITAIDPAHSTLTVKDLATKKPVTIHIGDDTQMRKVPENMAQMLAARLKGEAAAASGHSAGHSGPPAGAAPSGPPPTGERNGGQGAFNHSGSGANGDPQHLLSMAPAIKLSDLQKGEAVMVVAADGTADVNAVTLLAGVEPLLEAPAASNLLSNWSMGGGGAEAAAAGPQ